MASSGLSNSIRTIISRCTWIGRPVEEGLLELLDLLAG